VTWAFTIGQFEVRKPAIILHMVPIECLSPAHISCQCEQANALVGEHSHLCWFPARGCSMSAGSIGFAESLSIRFLASWCGRPGSCKDRQSLDGPIAKGSPLRLQGHAQRGRKDRRERCIGDREAGPVQNSTGAAERPSSTELGFCPTQTAIFSDSVQENSPVGRF
jgi:hypothetical protein